MHVVYCVQSVDCFFFFKQKTAYEMRISDWSSDVCSSDLPLAGSYYVESLTAALVAEARKLIGEVEELGGMTRAVESGMPKLRIEESAARRQARIDRGEEVIVGVNRYRAGEDEPVEILDIDNAARSEEHTSELKSLMRRSYAVFCLKKKKTH